MLFLLRLIMVGIDIEKINRFEHWTSEGYSRIFTDNEIKYAQSFENSLEHFCGFFCAKEAFVKALDDDGIVYKEIEILHTDSGRPYINRTKYIDAILREKHRNMIDISISHCKEYAIAVVEIE